MSTEYITPEEGMNPQEEALNDTVEETTETQAQEEQEETVPKSQFAQVLARAKKAEDEARRLRESKQSINSSISEEDIEIKILKSQGIDDELLGEMKALAKVRGKSILEIQNDPILRAMKEAKEAEAKAKAARLPASRGSAPVRKEKTFSTPGLSEAEFKALWREKQSK